MGNIYYYKTASDIWVFSSCRKYEAKKAVDYLRRLRSEGYRVERLYLDVPEHFEFIKALFFNKDYWDGRSWQDEYEERPLLYIKTKK